MIQSYQPGTVMMGRVPHGADLLEAIQAFCEKRKLTAASIQLIGAVQRAILGYYDQQTFRYETLTFEEGMEILGCTGNVSLKDGRIFPHLHLLLGDRRGRVFGGHLMPGTVVFAAEIAIQELVGEPLIRGFDPVTRLALWESARP